MVSPRCEQRGMKRATFHVPREITIRGKRWLVVRSHELIGEDGKHDVRSRMELERTADGATYPDGHPHIKREIHLASSLRGWEESVTLLHELLHACSSQPIPMNHEEKFIRDIETPLLRALEQLEWIK